jgi:redox-sensitive bicupin YhaK (pirin superfamily)
MQLIQPQTSLSSILNCLQTLKLLFQGGAATNTMLYFIEGSTASVGDKSVKDRVALTLNAVIDAIIANIDPTSNAEFLLLQETSIGEPVASFVMNTAAEIDQAFAEYRR